MQEFSTPSLIIAMPELLDPNFYRSVVLLVEKNEDGAFGLVINQPGGKRVEELCENLDVEWKGERELLALTGGPVALQQGFLLHGQLPEDRGVQSRAVTRHIGIASDMDSFRDLCGNPPEALRVFLGYSGWAPGQLDREMLEGAWLSTDATFDLVFEIPSEQVWEVALRRLGVDPKSLVSAGGGGLH